MTDHGFEQTVRYSQQLQLSTHLHRHKTLIEVTDAIRKRQQRPLQRIQEPGLLSPLLQTEHMTQLNPDEIQLWPDDNVHVVYCPQSNLKLASGFYPVATLLEAKVNGNVAIGTDGAASNNNLDVLEKLRTAAILAKAASNDATAVNAHQALFIAPSMEHRC